MPPHTLATQVATVAARQLLNTGNNQPPGPLISTTAIVLIVFVGFIPVIILAGVVIWLLGFYARDQACFPCCFRKRRERHRAAKRATNSPNSGTSTSSSEAVPIAGLPPMTALPDRMTEKHAEYPGHARTESGETDSSSLGVVNETRTFV